MYEWTETVSTRGLPHWLLPLPRDESPELSRILRGSSYIDPPSDTHASSNNSVDGASEFAAPGFRLAAAASSSD